MLTDRYRIAGPLGKGGMGEVYRADDLKLGQPVALKFLSTAVETDASCRERFLNEVRLARQVSHPSVCRVYDVEETDGQFFLSMEYVDGEDLGSLLKRIGRLPRDKALQIARQICAGLSAAHDQGILHRDLKPANVMIDGRGRAKISDFGLAAVSESIDQREVLAGTPRYMAPEQLAGEEVSRRSDIYSLGLVLYELFTGKLPFEGPGFEAGHLQPTTTPSSPLGRVEGLDPAIESALLRCLETDPENRPTSVMAVAAALPGADPLAAALAAGETPSPELVAAAGASDAMDPKVALLLALSSIALFVLAAWVVGSHRLQAYVPLEKPPEVLLDRAREIIRQVGYTEDVYSRPYDSASGYEVWRDVLERMEEEDDSPGRWDPLRDSRSGAVTFWYRQQPTLMWTFSVWGSVAPGPVSTVNPSARVKGTMIVRLDLDGRLRTLVHMPIRFSEEAQAPSSDPDWSQLFELAGLDMASFTRVDPGYDYFMIPQQRAAWVGQLPGAVGSEVRVEAGMSNGRPVLFQMLLPSDIQGLAGPVQNWGPRFGSQQVSIPRQSRGILTVSSMATIRSSSGSNSMSALSSVVFPDPVPPETRMLRRVCNTRSAFACTPSGSAPCATRSSAENVRLPKRRTVMATVGLAGGTQMATREPSSRRASTIGELAGSRPRGRAIWIAALSSAAPSSLGAA